MRLVCYFKLRPGRGLGNGSVVARAMSTMVGHSGPNYLEELCFIALFSYGSFTVVFSIIVQSVYNIWGLVVGHH